MADAPSRAELLAALRVVLRWAMSLEKRRLEHLGLEKEHVVNVLAALYSLAVSQGGKR